ncbi:MAG: flagellar biosynthetic protein FliO [Clostridiales bacterium]|jgi:flagellar protein FliO/FliZ|nr:flagellar biosynthetic protein FliO [Bacillota bacterium]NLK04022.1 flagellar biosynthetic protein FliO [Clostridiales bacterium]
MSTNTKVILLKTQDGELLKKVNSVVNDVEAEKISTFDNVLQLLGLVLLLILILIAAYYTSRFVGRYKLGQLKDSNIQVIEIYRISTNKMLQIVKIANKYVVLGISKEQITYITELDESQVLTHDAKEEEKQSFKQIFDKFKGSIK